MCHGGHDSVHAYTALPLEEPVKGARDPAAAEEALPGEDEATEEKQRHDAPNMAATVMTSLDDAASSWTAPSSLPPNPLPALDLDPAVLPAFRQPVQVPSPSHPALLYQEQENPAPQEACDDVDMGTPAARDIPEVTDFVRARVVDEFHDEKLENKKAAAVAAGVPISTSSQASCGAGFSCSW
jgi:glutaredoxin domain-containing cysteine-rich protein 1